MAVSSTDSQQRIWQVTNLGWFLPGRLPSSSVIETRGFKTCLYVPSFREDVLSKENIGSYRPTRRVWVGAFSMYSAHAQWYAPYPLANAGIPNTRREKLLERERDPKEG
jgi:hypothetical protein